MADGSITFSTELDNKNLEKDLAKINKEIRKTEESISSQEAKRSPLVAQAEELQRKMSEARAEVKRYQQEWVSGVTGADGQQATAQGRLNGLQTEYQKVVEQIEKIDSKLMPAYEKLDGMKVQAGELQQRIAKASSFTGRMRDATAAAEKQMAKLTKRVASLAKRVFVFTLITQALRSLKDWMWSAIQTNDDAVTAVAQLKGALRTLAQPLVEVVIPAFTALVNVLTAVVSKIAQLVSAVFGTTAEASAEAAEALYNEQQALDGVGSSSKKASKQLASFDEINKLGSGDASDSTSSIAPDFSTVVSGEMDKIATLVGGALLGIGAILAFSGTNIPLGLSLMALGAATLASAVVENWDAIVTALQGPVGLITALLSGSLLVLGAVLAFSGANVGLGIGLMVLGAAGLATTIAANWDSIVEAMQGPIGSLTGLLSTALLVIGAILAFSGANLPLGLGMMAVGAAGLATYAAANWDTVSEALQGPIGAVLALVSGALLVLGAILTFSGANIPLGIGLLVLGAAGLATTMAVNWETIQTALQGPVGTITALVSGALLVLGAILAFSGAAIPLGIGLMAAGAVGLATSIAANWNKITEAVGGTVDSIIAIASAALLVLGVILIFTGAGIPLGLGMLLMGGAGLAATVAPNWDFILDKIKGAWSDIKLWWSSNAAKFFTLDYWKDLGGNMIDGLLAGLEGIFSGLSTWASDVWSYLTGAFSGNTNSKFAIGGGMFGGEVSLKAPGLATGSVIPPNREFLAVLGDNKTETEVVSPLSTMKQAMIEALRESGGGGGNVNITFEGELSALARVLRPYIKGEDRRVGGSLVTK